jgi:DNA (cytosine-5)-methyltransferase 1
MQPNLFDLLGEDNPFKEQKANDYYWTLKDLANVSKNNKKVFSCFACGGGSSMGYKLAGYDVIGCCEIDPKMNEIYIQNNHPKHNFLMDIREFNKIPKKDLPKELFNLDILDGSPPCTTFSMAGQREKTWGKKKKFREGQVAQTLDDLSFVFIKTVKKLKPKVVVMENVEGLLNGNAWEYVKRIYKEFKAIGYVVNHWLLRGETMGVPQARHRVVFVAHKEQLHYPELKLCFNYEKVPYGKIKTLQGLKLSENRAKTRELLANVKYGENDLSNAHKRLYGKDSFFQSIVLYDDKVVPTIRAGAADYYRYGTFEQISQGDIITASTFPQDYNFGSNAISNVCYICGMSVPPIMIKRVATEIYKQWFSLEN